MFNKSGISIIQAIASQIEFMIDKLQKAIQHCYGEMIKHNDSIKEHELGIANQQLHIDKAKSMILSLENFLGK
jgi:hypothetical protein